MTESYKLNVKLGPAEFSAEGPEETVKQAFQQFLEAASGQVSGSIREPAGTDDQRRGSSQALLERAFSRDGDIVSLRHLPPQDNPNRIADAAILLMYGFRAILKVEDVPVTKLNRALKRSGLTVNRLDRFVGPRSGLFMKGGTRSGGRYTLNNLGLTQSESWLREWYGNE